MERHEQRQRWRLLHRLVRLLELPMTVLGLIWITLLTVGLVRGLHGDLAALSKIIWIVFGLDFALELSIAPRKLLYLKRHWLVAISLAVPALRIFRFMRIAHLARAIGAARAGQVLAVVNRELAALNAALQRRGFGYVLIVTVAVILLGAAGIDRLEHNPADPQGIHGFGDALWWTAMLMTTLGPTSWPVTIGGRVLCFGLSLYAFTVFGYLTATLATFFIDRDADRSDTAVAGERSIAELKSRLDALQEILETRLPAA